MRVLVTGATGFVGAAFWPRLVRAGHEVRPSSRRAALNGVMGVGDVAEARWDEHLAGMELVVHLASRAHVTSDSAKDPYQEYWRVNVAGARNLAEAAVRQGVRRFVYVSSVKVNGERSERPMTEADTPKPEDAYGKTKWEAERVLGEICRAGGMELVIVRPPLVYGPGVKANFRALLRAVEWGIPLPFQTVNNRRSLIGLTNLCEVLVRACEHPRAAGETFLVSDNQDVSTRDLLMGIAAAMNKPPRLFPFPPAVLKAGATLLGKQQAVDKLLNSLQVDCSHAIRLLEWEPHVAFKMEIEATVRDYMNEQRRAEK